MTNVSVIQVAYACCLILTADHKLLVQERYMTFLTHPGRITPFGGKIEKNEPPVQALRRELHEELGVCVSESALIYIGSIVKTDENHSELIHEYFWHDVENRVQACYEGKLFYLATAGDILHARDRMMPGLIWLVEQCCKKELLPDAFNTQLIRS